VPPKLVRRWHKVDSREQSDVGVPKRAGAGEFDASQRSYKITGGGRRAWFTNDALHFVWKKVSSDVTLAADIAFEGQGGDPHRKACLLIRRKASMTIQPTRMLWCMAMGLTSLQYREAKGTRDAREIQSNVAGPRRLRISAGCMCPCLSRRPTRRCGRRAGRFGWR
jgi:hypothetical protein